MKVLIIAPHMDDEVLGCGGTIAKHVSRGDDVCVCFIAHRIYSHRFDAEKYEVEKQHAMHARDILGYRESVFFNLHDERLDAALQDIIIPLERCVAERAPETVYLPFRGDNNQDHRAVYEASRVVLRPSATPFLTAVYMYEVPSSTEQSPPLPENSFMPNYFINITDCIDIKIRAFECYETETRRFPHPRSEKSLKVLAQKRGMEIGFEYAEAFMMIREKW